jgi:hypothetical protein
MENTFISINHNQPNEWRIIGGIFCLKLQINNSPRYVIVDDRFPINENGELAVTLSTDLRVIWPMIIVKALAKILNVNTGEKRISGYEEL